MIKAIRFLFVNSTKRGRRFFLLAILFGSFSTLCEILAAGTFSILASSAFGGKNNGFGILSSIFPFALTRTWLIFIFSAFFLGKLIFQYVELRMKNECAAETFNSLLEQHIFESEELNAVQDIHTFNHQVLYPSLLLVAEIMFAIMFIPFIIISTGVVGLVVLSISFLILFPLTWINSKLVKDVSKKRKTANLNLQASLYDDKRLREDLGSQRLLSAKSRKFAVQVNKFDQKFVTLSSNPRFILEFAFLGIVICLLWFSQNLISQKSQIYVFSILGYSFFRFVPSLTRIGLARNQISAHRFMFNMFGTRTAGAYAPNNRLELSALKSIQVLEPIAFSKFKISANNWTLIKGPTGIGKTRLLKILAGVSSEDFIIHSKDFSQFSESEWVPNASFVSQAPYLAGNTLLEMVSSNNSVIERNEPTLKHLMEVCVIDHRLLDTDTDFLKLSGGQRKQVALLRALLTRNAFLVLDEFTAGLDFELATQILSNLKHVDFVQTLIMSTHEDLYDNWFEVFHTIS